MNNEELQNNAGQVFKPIITNVNYDTLSNTMSAGETVGVSNALIISVPDNNIENNSLWVSDNNGHITPIALSVQKLNNIVSKPSDSLITSLIETNIKPTISNEVTKQISKSTLTRVIYVDFYDTNYSAIELINCEDPHKYFYTGESMKLTIRTSPNHKSTVTAYIWELYGDDDEERIQYKKYLLTRTIDVDALKNDLFTIDNDQIFTNFLGFLDKDKNNYNIISKLSNNYQLILLHVSNLLNIPSTQDINNKISTLFKEALIIRMDRDFDHGHITIDEAYDHAYKYVYMGETITFSEMANGVTIPYKYYIWEYIGNDIDDPDCTDEYRINDKKYLLTNTININILRSQIITNTNNQYFTAFKGFLTEDKHEYQFNKNTDATTHILLSVDKLFDNKPRETKKTNNESLLKILSNNLMIKVDNDFDLREFHLDDVIGFSAKYVYTGEYIDNVYTSGRCYIWEYIGDEDINDLEDVRNNIKKYLLTTTIDRDTLLSQVINSDDGPYFTSFVGYLSNDNKTYHFDRLDGNNTQILVSVGKFIE